MKITSLRLTRALAAWLFLQVGLTTSVTSAPNPQDLPPPPYATITYSSTQSPPQTVVVPCAKGVFALVGLQPDQIIQVTVQYPVVQPTPPSVPPLANLFVVPGAIINAEPLDGGTVTVPTGGLVVASNGTVTFTFQATHDPGVNQISLRQAFPAPSTDPIPTVPQANIGVGLARQELGLQFWVNDTANPKNNPAMITADDPSY